MVVDRDIWQAFARRFGIVEVSSPKAMVEALRLLSVCGVPKGPRLTAITYSGGLNGMIVSDAPGLGLELKQPAPRMAKRLCDRLPETVPVANPLDMNLPFRSSTEMSMAEQRSTTVTTSNAPDKGACDAAARAKPERIGSFANVSLRQYQ